jgi:hypothetical protein|tara:strand:+ start:274 stop:474 length:201 start_codon:yes stop_codon:yes gene_type:complete
VGEGRFFFINNNMSESSGYGKGDRARNYNTKQYRENYDKIFGVKKNRPRSRPISKRINTKKRNKKQ